MKVTISSPWRSVVTAPSGVLISIDASRSGAQTWVLMPSWMTEILCRYSCGYCWNRSEEHTSELQSLMRISYAVFCLKTNTSDQYSYIYYLDIMRFTSNIHS